MFGVLGPHFKKSEELWARPPVLTPVLSQANHSSSHRRWFRTVRLPRNLHACFDSLVRVSRRSWETGVCHCLEAWDWWSRRGNTSVGGHIRADVETRGYVGGHAATATVCLRLLECQPNHFNILTRRGDIIWLPLKRVMVTLLSFVRACYNFSSH